MPTKPTLDIRLDRFPGEPASHLPDDIHIHRNGQVGVGADHERGQSVQNLAVATECGDGGRTGRILELWSVFLQRSRKRAEDR